MLKPQKGMQKKAKIGPSDKAGDEQKGGLVGCARKFAELPDCVMKLICMVTLLLSANTAGPPSQRLMLRMCTLSNVRVAPW